MNRIYRLVFNHALGQVQVTSEIGASPSAISGASRRVPSGPQLTPLALGLLLSVSSLGAMAQSLPTGGNIVSGSGQIGTPNGNQLTIDQSSNKLAINWNSFDIGAGQKLLFNQPGTDAIVLNRVLGADGSKIMGQLDANGRVFLINPNGVLFGKSASVNVGGLVASTLNISDADFAAGRYQFKGNGSNAAVINQGHLHAADGGAVALLGGTVSNQGVVVANQGSVALAAGNQVTLDFAGDGKVSVQVNEAVRDALVENRQLIQADGGQVLLTASAADALLQTVINNEGVIQARTLGEKDGKIVLLGDFAGGTVQVGGTLDASAPTGGNGGFIDTSGAHVQVANTAKVTTHATAGKTGTWLIDPTDFTISAGNATQTDSGIGADTLTSNLATTNVTLQTVAAGAEKGDIHVNADVSYAQNQLTLNTHNNINVNATITVNGSGTLALNYGGTAGSTGTAPVAGSNLNVNGKVDFAGVGMGLLSVNGHGYTVINSLNALQDIGTNISTLGSKYALGGNIDASAAAGWNSGQGFNPIGSNTGGFTGIFDGLGHTVSNLTINRPTQNYVGLFGYTYNATLRNVGLVGGSIVGNSYVGSLVGRNNANSGTASITNAFATGQVTGSGNYVGGLVGYNSANGGTASITNVYATGEVTSSRSYVGGLVGYNATGAGGKASIANAYATGQVTGTTYAGGLVGSSSADGGLVSIANAYATGPVTGTGYVGGLVGKNGASGGTASITNVYATGEVNGDGNVGGLVGFNSAYDGAASIANAYATGPVTGIGFVGGLVGYNAADGVDAGSAGTASIANAYATGQVNGDGNVGGLVGYNTISIGAASIANAHWDNDSTGQTNAVGGNNGGTITSVTAITNSNRYLHASYVHLGSWSETASGSGIWQAQDTNGVVQWIMFEGSTRPFLASEYSTTVRNAHQLQLMAYNLGANYVLTNDIDASATSASNASGMWSSSGFSPISGNGGFTGSFDGLGHTVSNLTIYRPTQDYVGLFGYVQNATLRNIGLLDNRITGSADVGGLIGFIGTNNGITSISNVYATGQVSGARNVGGLIGSTSIDNGTLNITDAHTTGDVTGIDYVGGLIGRNAANTGSTASIASAYATGLVTGTHYVGGLVGHNRANGGTARITNAYATGEVTGSGGNVGGLVGYNHAVNGGMASITNAYATGHVATGSGSYVGGLVGWNGANTGTTSITNTYATGDVITGPGSYYVGGLVGYTAVANSGTTNIANAYATGEVIGGSYVGGLAGFNYSVSGTASIANAYATGQVTGNGGDVGGLVGYNRADDGTASITNAYATGQVSASESVGGLVGYNHANGGMASIANAYATGYVSGGPFSNAGGLVGYNYANGGTASIANAYATGMIAGDGKNGGLVGYNRVDSGMASITNAYATGEIRQLGSANGGLVGFNEGATSINQSFYATTDANDRTINSYIFFNPLGQAKTLAELKQLSTFAGWGSDVDDQGGTGSIWRMYEGSTTPLLRSFLKTVTVTADASGITGKTYDGSISSGTTGFITDVAATLDGTLNYATSSKNAGTYRLADGTLTLNGLYSGQQGYDISYVSSSPTSLTITKATLTIAGSTVGHKTYDGTATATATAGQLAGLVGGETLKVAAAGIFDNQNAGSRTATVNYTLANDTGLASNYTLASTSHTANINKAGLTITAGNGSKTYGQTGGINGFASNGLVNGDAVSSVDLASNGSAATANVGNYTITASNADGTGLSNYDISYVDGVLAIGKAGLTITAGNGGKTYGQSGGFNSFASSGLVNGDAVSSVDLASNGSAATANVGDYAITAANADGTGLSNYDISYANGVLSIGKAGLTITASDASKQAGQAVALAGYTSQGLLNGDTISSVALSSRGSGVTAKRGQYAIVASNAAGAQLGNYDIQYQNGTLDVTGQSNVADPSLVAQQTVANMPRTEDVAFAAALPATQGSTGTAPRLYDVQAGGIGLPADPRIRLNEGNCLAKQPE